MKHFSMFKNIFIGILVGLPLIAWGLVLGVKGAAGPIGWWLLILFGSIGLLSALVSLGVLLYKAFKHQKLSKTQAGLVIWSLFVAWPASWLLGQNQIAYPVSLESMSPSVVVELPFDQMVQTEAGGDSLSTNDHAWMPVERWAYDFVLPTKKTTSKNLKDYPIFGQNVIAPANAKVVGTFDNEADGIPHEDGGVSQLGNYVFLELESTKTYLILSHLKKDSVTVSVGDSVVAGDLLGKVGNSGNSSEPHLHIHHQRQNPVDYPLLISEGLPLYFLTHEGKSMPTGGFVTQGSTKVLNGDFVSPRRSQ